MVEPPASPTARALAWAWRHWWFRAGCWTAAVFALLAIYAPLLATEAAWWWSGPDGWGFPALTDLFNRRSYPKHYDLAFNLMVVGLPLAVVAWFGLRRRLSPMRRLGGIAAVGVALFILAQLPLLPRGDGRQALWDDRPTSAWSSITVRATPAAATSYLLAPIPHRWDATYPGAVLQPPGWVNPATGARCWLGTDPSGHDVAARLLCGTRISLSVGLVSTLLALAIGTALGAISGYLGGTADVVIQRLVEIMMCFPVFLLIISVVAMAPSFGIDRITLIMLVIGLTGWAGTARLVRGEFLGQSVRDYVSAARSLGLPGGRIMFIHILPNAMAPLLISATFGVAGAVLGESGLSFVGLGDPNTPSWGQILNQGRENPTFTWLIYVPGITIFALVLALNAIGEGLRQALDPKAN